MTTRRHDAPLTAATTAPEGGGRRVVDVTLTAGPTGSLGPVAAADSGEVVRIGRYVIEGQLGAGGMGIVYAAHDPTLGRPIALKVIRRGGDPTAAARMVREAQAMARVSHPNVIQVFDAGIDPDGRVYIAMERICGNTLERWIKAQPRELDEILDVFAQAGRGLAAAHGAGLVHRDFKPENVIVGDDGRVRVLDFGLARAAVPVDNEGSKDGDPAPADDDDDAAWHARILREAAVESGVSPDVVLTATGALVGTPRFMSPEQWRQGGADARTDQFSFCVALYRAITRQHPFADSSSAILRDAVLAGELRPMPAALPRRLRRVMRRGLAHRPADRYPGMTELVAQLARAPRRWPTIAAIATAVGTLVALVLSVRTSPQSMPELAPVIESYRSWRLTSRGDVQRAAVSPSGKLLAFIADQSLVVQDLAPGGEEWVLLDQGANATGVIDRTLAWSPDNQRIAIWTPRNDEVSPWNLTVIGLDGTVEHLPRSRGFVALTGAREFVTADDPHKQFGFYSFEEPNRPLRTCPIPGQYTFIGGLYYHPGVDAVFVVLRHHAEGTTSLVRVDRSCHVRTLASHIALSSFVLHPVDARIFIRPTLDDDSVIELDPDGRPTGLRHRLGSDLGQLVAARRDGGFVHLIVSQDWRLTAHRRDGTRSELGHGTAPSSFAVSPDGTYLAYLEKSGASGELRLHPTAGFTTRGKVLVSGAIAAGWSPDGQRLAVVLSGDDGFGVAIIERMSGAITWRRRVPWMDTKSDVVWIDDQSIAVRIAGNQTYRQIDLRDGSERDLMDRSHGWTFELARSRRGDLAWYWNVRGKGRSAWRSVPGGEPVFLTAVTQATHVTWSHEGDSVLLFDEHGGLRSVDVPGGKVEDLPDIDLPPGAKLAGLHVVPDGMLLQTARQRGDVYISTPE